jgi:hypothetical protein
MPDTPLLSADPLQLWGIFAPLFSYFAVSLERFFPLTDRELGQS